MSKSLSLFEEAKKYYLRPSEYYYFYNDNQLKGQLEKIDDPEERSKFVYNQLKGKSDKWQDEQNIGKPFENGSDLFGHSKMFEYLSRPGLSRHDGLHNFNKIAEVFKLSGLKPDEFFNNILSQVQKDDSEYDELGSAHHKLNSLTDNINADFKGISLMA